MPAAFIGHGSPMNAVDRNRYTEAWRVFGRTVPRPRAILVISAHWYTNATAVTAMPRPRTVHDFYGFPSELYEVQYPAPGLPELVEQVAEAADPMWVGADTDSWGIDHGTWSVLVHAFPDASIPVVQLSINAFKDFDHHLELGRKLAPLREDGVLILGSGNVVHNLRALDPSRPDTGFDWAHRFDDAAKELLLNGNSTDVTGLVDHPDFAAAVPTPDHYLPLIYIAGLADDQPMHELVGGYSLGSLSMTAYTLGIDCPGADSVGTGAAAAVPDDVPAVDINL
ncbi:4,5-DOPA-extradiol-dioxygenase [Nocardia sp. NPDC003693]